MVTPSSKAKALRSHINAGQQVKIADILTTDVKSQSDDIQIVDQLLPLKSEIRFQEKYP